MEERQRIEKGDVGRLEDVLGPDDPLFQNPSTAIPGAKRWPSDECSKCGRPGSEHEFVPDHTSTNFRYKGVPGYLRCPPN